MIFPRKGIGLRVAGGGGAKLILASFKYDMSMQSRIVFGLIVLLFHIKLNACALYTLLVYTSITMEFRHERSPEIQEIPEILKLWGSFEKVNLHYQIAFSALF